MNDVEGLIHLKWAGDSLRFQYIPLPEFLGES